MPILDCHDYGTTLSSVSGILGLRVEDLSEVILSFSFDEDDSRPFSESLFSHTLLKANLLEHSGTYYFHLTRTQDPESLRAGVEPLGSMLDTIWSYLGELAEVGAKGWSEFRTALESGGGGDSGELYRMKSADSFHWGPYGVLIRESAFDPGPSSQHDYLAGPEIVEDICRAASAHFKIPLLSRFKANSHACIVKFLTNDRRPMTLKPALAYLWERSHSTEISFATSWSHDASGLITPEQIVQVEVVDAKAPRAADS